MRFHPIASSSRGNAYLAEDGRAALLLECGVSFPSLQRLTGFRLSCLSGCLISHEHGDHAACCGQLLRSGVPVHASRGTAQALGCSGITPLPQDGTGAYLPVSLGGFDVLPFPLLHDAAEPVGFLVRSRSDGEKLVFAPDTGGLALRFSAPTLIAVECNYSEALLDSADHLPPEVRRRIRSAHMSLDQVCRWLDGTDRSHLRHVYLMHLSDTCSDAQSARHMAEQAVGAGVPVTICPVQSPLPPDALCPVT